MLRNILKWAVLTALAIVALDLVLAWTAMLGIVPGEIYQMANLPAMLVFGPGGPGSVKDSLSLWVPQMAALAFALGAMVGVVKALTSHSTRSRARTRAPG